MLAAVWLAVAASTAHADAGATVRCTTQVTGGVSSFGLQAWPQTWQKPYWFPADAYVFAGAGWKLLWLHGASPGVRVAHDSCRAVKTHVPLAAGGMPRVAHIVLGDYPTVRVRCTIPGEILIRYHVDQDGGGLPRSASVAVRLARGNVPLAYVTWSWSQVTAWASPRCETTLPTQP